MPITKNIGSTVLGVRIGLNTSRSASTSFPCPLSARMTPGKTHCHAFNLCCRNAVSKQNPTSQSSSHRQSASPTTRKQSSNHGLLAGLLLFAFFSPPVLPSCELIEASCWVSVFDIAGEGSSRCDRNSLIVLISGGGTSVRAYLRRTRGCCYSESAKTFVAMLTHAGG